MNKALPHVPPHTYLMGNHENFASLLIIIFIFAYRHVILIMLFVNKSLSLLICLWQKKDHVIAVH